MRTTKVYILEEDSGWRDFATKALVKRGYLVVSGATFADLVPQIKNENSSLTILGFSTIGPDELGLLERILRNKHLGPTVVVASSLSRGAIREAFLRGAADVARKSFDEDELADLVQEQLNPRDPKSNYASLGSRRRNNE